LYLTALKIGSKVQIRVFAEYKIGSWRTQTGLEHVARTVKIRLVLQFLSSYGNYINFIHEKKYKE